MLLAARAARRSTSSTATRLEWLFGLFPALKKFWHHPAGKLSGGQKQMLAIARAIVEPRKLLLIDEPSKGLAPAIVLNLIAALRELKRTETTVLLVEQNFQVARALGDRVAVMDRRPRRPSRHHGRARRRRGAAAAPARPVARGAPMKRRRTAHDAPPPQPRRPWPMRSRRRRFDLRAAGLVVVLALVAWPAIGSSSTWVTLTVAGLAMGMIIFIVASGLTLVFGLMDVLNFGHGLFIALGAYLATSVFVGLAGWTTSAERRAQPRRDRSSPLLAAMLVAGAVGFVFERVHRPAGLRPAPEADPDHDGRR